MPGPLIKFYFLQSRLKGLLRDTAWSFGMNRHTVNKPGAGRMLVYHGICLSRPLRFSTMFITLRSFESQLRFYKKYFNIISLDDFYQQRFSPDKFSICLSFDDGFANNYTHVLPLLEQYRIPASFFITGIREAGYDILWNDFLRMAGRYGPSRFSFGGKDFFKDSNGRYVGVVDHESLYALLRASNFALKASLIKTLEASFSFRAKVHADFWLQLNQDQIRKLSASKWVTIGSHGYYHNDLAKIPLGEADEEMARSKQGLERITGKEIKAIAFPYGSYTREVIASAKNAGFRQLLATEFRFAEDSDDPTMKERLTINPFITTINQAHATISGNYS